MNRNQYECGTWCVVLTDWVLNDVNGKEGRVTGESEKARQFVFTDGKK